VKVKLGLIFKAKDLNCRIPTEYHELLDVFDELITDIVQPHGTYDYSIELKDGTDPPSHLINALSVGQLKARHEYLDNIQRMR
jgi:hypothetical protein